MLVDTLNIGHYRVTDYNGRKHSMMIKAGGLFPLAFFFV